MKITLRLGKFFLIALATAMAFSCSVKAQSNAVSCSVNAQSDNFDDGNDTVNPTWTHYDPIADLTGVPGGSWTFPGSNTYRLQAFTNSDPVTFGPGRIASTLTNVYSDFYTTVDVVDWDDTLHQAFGILARLENVGPGTTTGYVFTYQELDHTVSISIINNEVATDLTGTSTAITLYRTNAYRFVFTGQGTNFEGRVYQLPDVDNAIVIVPGSDSTYSNGIGGLLVFDNSGGSGTADATYDNYFAAVCQPAPVIASIHNIARSGVAANTIGVRFDRVVTLPSATNHANYVVNAGTVNIADVQLRADGRSVEVVAGGGVGEFFSVCATNVQNEGGNSSGTIATGYTSEYSDVTVGTPGDPSDDGQVFTSFWDTFDTTAGGSGFGELLDDHFHFIQQPMTGDFDVRVRVLQLEMADSASQAGLMARETLDAGSASIQTFFTPTGGLNQIKATVRPVVGTDALDFLTTTPVTAFPNDWLRMTRSNDVFTAYYATNGTDWTVSGVTTQSFATNLYVGMAVSAHNSATNATASFIDFYPQGGRPGDEIHPALSASQVGTNIVFRWPQTPRSYALEVATSLGASNEWSLLMLPVGFNGSTRAFQANIPIGLLGQKLFVRNTRVDKLIPDIPGIMVTTGMILSPGAGLVTNASNGTLNGFGVVSNSVVASTNTVTWLNVGSTNWIDTEQSSSSSSSGGTQLDTVLFVRNVTTGFLNSTNDNDSTIYGEIRSKMRPLPPPSIGAQYPITNKFTFTAAAKTNSTFSTVVRIHLGP